MKHENILLILVLILIAAAGVASSTGIFSQGGPGPFDHTSVRGVTVPIYGIGIYRHMSAEVAPQGIAQDYVTLFLAIPLLVLSWYVTRRGSLRSRFLFAGTLGYFLVTYLFYLTMGTYNPMFLAYVVALGASFYAFVLTLLSFNTATLPGVFRTATARLPAGGFLIFNAVAIAFLWLGIVIPPLLNGSVIPVEVGHYTTLIVQGLDLALLLPAAAIVGLLFIKGSRFGFLFAPIYLVFLSFLMTALTAKVLAMAHLGYPVVPVIFIIPTLNLLSIGCSVYLLRHVDEHGVQS